MLNARTLAILRELMAVESTVTSEDLANTIQVTSRTIRNDIKELDSILSEHGARIHSIRGTGHELIVEDKALFQTFLHEFVQKDIKEQEVSPSVREERVHYLIKRFLLSNDYLKLDDLADELFVSKSTVQNDLRDVKDMLAKFEVELEKRPNYGLKVKGDEKKLRYCMAQYLCHNNKKESDVDYSRYSLFPQNVLTIIRDVLLKKINKLNLKLSDHTLHNLIIHIAIACKRIQHKQYVYLSKEEFDKLVNNQEFELAKNIKKELETYLHISFPKEEIAYIALHLLGAGTPENHQFNHWELTSCENHECYYLAMDIIKAIDDTYKFEFQKDYELIHSLSTHLKTALHRFRHGMNLRNPMIDSIKTNYPIAFQMSVIAGIVIEEKIGIDINEDEIGYIALHIEAAMERNMIVQPKKCLVVCASGVGSARLLANKLQSNYKGRTNVVGTTQSYKLTEYPLDTIDFVISTIPIVDKIPIPVIEVNTFLERADYKKIEDAILENSKAKILDYTNEQLVFLQEKLETWEEVISFFGERLTTLGLVDDLFVESVMKRERMSDTNFGNLVAIPHPDEPQTEETFWAICTLQKPVQWGDKKAQFICLLSVKKNGLDDLRKMYELLGDLIEDKDRIQKILKCKTYEQFIKIFYE